MKRTVAFLLVAILSISILAIAFAAPTCPQCHMEGRSGTLKVTYSDWEFKGVEHEDYVELWSERTVTEKCSLDSRHNCTYIQKKNYRTRPLDNPPKK